MRWLLGVLFVVLLLFVAEVIVVIMDGKTYLHAMDSNFVYFMTGIISGTIFCTLNK